MIFLAGILQLQKWSNEGRSRGIRWGQSERLMFQVVADQCSTFGSSGGGSHDQLRSSK